MNPFVSKKFRFYSFISMVLLVFVHGYNLNNRYMQPWTIVEEPITFNTFTQYFLGNGLFRFRIPMLFAISGYLFALYDDQPYGKRILKRTRTLLLPYFLWSIIGLLIAVLFTQIDGLREVVYQTHLQPYSGPFSEYDVNMWITAIIRPTSFQLWFLRCLFFYNLLYPLLLKGVLKIPWVVFTLFTLMFISTFGLFIIEGEGLLFFSLGVWLCKRKKDIEHPPKWMNTLVITIIFVAASVVKTWLAFKGLQVIGEATFPVLSILHKLVVVSGLLVVWFGGNRVVEFFMERKWFIHVSAYSFIIYALHVPLITYLIDPTFHLLSGIPHYRWVTFVLLPLVIVAFCILVGWVMRKTMPKVYGVLTGGKRVIILVLFVPELSKALVLLP